MFKSSDRQISQQIQQKQYENNQQSSCFPLSQMPAIGCATNQSQQFGNHSFTQQFIHDPQQQMQNPQQQQVHSKGGFNTNFNSNKIFMNNSLNTGNSIFSTSTTEYSKFSQQNQQNNAENQKQFGQNPPQYSVQQQNNNNYNHQNQNYNQHQQINQNQQQQQVQVQQQQLQQHDINHNNNINNTSNYDNGNSMQNINFFQNKCQDNYFEQKEQQQQQQQFFNEINQEQLQAYQKLLISDMFESVASQFDQLKTEINLNISKQVQAQIQQHCKEINTEKEFLLKKLENIEENVLTCVNKYYEFWTKNVSQVKENINYNFDLFIQDVHSMAHSFDLLKSSLKNKFQNLSDRTLTTQNNQITEIKKITSKLNRVKNSVTKSKNDNKNKNDNEAQENDDCQKQQKNSMKKSVNKIEEPQIHKIQFVKIDDQSSSLNQETLKNN